MEILIFENEWYFIWVKCISFYSATTIYMNTCCKLSFEFLACSVQWKISNYIHIQRMAKIMKCWKSQLKQYLEQSCGILQGPMNLIKVFTWFFSSKSMNWEKIWILGELAWTDPWAKLPVSWLPLHIYCAVLFQSSHVTLGKKANECISQNVEV